MNQNIYSWPEHAHQVSRGIAFAKGLAAPMDVLIRTVGMDLTDDLKKKVLMKMGRVRQYAPGAFRARVQLQKTRPNEFRAHVLYELKGNDVSAEHRATDPLEAVTAVAEKIRRRLRRRKTARLAGRVRHQRRNGSLITKKQETT
ncbi:MAG TPA: HPF/RaiA family ribosome-associated protein [Clostridia bacterium]|nr:HPF/RaiA family ribosome-associated protein [Clostridia bacterium]